MNSHLGIIYRLLFTADGRTLIAGNSNKFVTFWNVRTRQELMTLTGHERDTTGFAFTKDGRTLVSSSFDRTIRFWDTAQ
jgi:WD40 repeat protein